MRVGIFFFKQKTAYERRISDWSSYVCSSDLTTGWGTLGTVTFVASSDFVKFGTVSGKITHNGAAGTSLIATPSVSGLVNGTVCAFSVYVYIPRLEERSVGKECFSQCRSGWSQYN